MYVSLCIFSCVWVKGSPFKLGSEHETKIPPICCGIVARMLQRGEQSDLYVMMLPLEGKVPPLPRRAGPVDA